MRPRPRRWGRPATSAPRASRCALEALSRFKAIARILDVKNIWAIATAACRDASDGPDFIARGEKALGARIQILSGQREAELAANGIMMGFRAPDGFAGDLGGGSLEIIEVKGEALRQSVTLPLGGLRLLDAADGRIDEAIDIADDADRPRGVARERARADLLRGRRHLARHRPPAHGADRTIRCTSCTAT